MSFLSTDWDNIAAHRQVQAVMDEIDTNKNGLVELEEFIVWSVKNN